MITGIHHVTAIAGDAQANLDFYAGVLGLRLVKTTVNFDDPSTYHLYYGDGLGRPGTILTFFPWPNARKGRRGIGQVTTITLTVPKGSLDYWGARLEAHGVDPGERGFPSFEDPDGIRLALKEVEAYGDGSGSGTVPPEYAIRGIWSVTLWVTNHEKSAQVLTDVMGWHRPNHDLFMPQEGAQRDIVVLTAQDEYPSLPRGLMGVGVVHHVAFRVADDATEQEWLAKLQGLGFHTSPIKDRQYFHSIYFREPGGVLFELATDPPGFTADEPLETLGTHLKLPPWLEPNRPQIEAALPKLQIPTGTETTVSVP